MWYASWLVKHNYTDFSNAIRTFIVILISATGASETLALVPDFVKGGQAMKSVFEILDRRTQIDPDHPGLSPPPDSIHGEVELKHVDFAYPTQPDLIVLKDLNLRAHAGKTVALVGPSGCGKSSIISLIQRFYDPTSGSVMIDGKDIRSYNLMSIRQAMAFVPQEPCLFGTSVHDNIAYGCENATEAEVIEAATLANAHKFISDLPDGYRTLVGERGVQLSGGPQRIAIARAFIRKAPIMLLDEATSALDVETERFIHEALGRVSSGRTTIVVAHRLSTVRNVHAIAVIEDGHVLQKGSDSYLKANFPEGFYARMVQLQQMPTTT